MPNYPGLGRPLRYNEKDDDGHYPIGAHGSCHGSQSDIITIRELAMMVIMEKLTDKKDWHKKVFDEDIVAKWRKDALAISDKEFTSWAIENKRQWWPEDGQVQLQHDYGAVVDLLTGVMNEETFGVCVQELQSKAKYFEKSGIIPTLDACSTVAKSDTLVSKDLHDALQNAFDKLKIDQQTDPDWHPNSNNMVQDLVHPSMYPLIYGRSLGFKKECVGVANAIEQWAGKGDIIPQDTWERSPEDRFRFGVGSANVPPEYWSKTYQWLPANMAFQEDGSMRFTSYINNLYPTQYSDIYRTIEKLVETSLPIWDQCLAMGEVYDNGEGSTRTKLRIEKPENGDDENRENWIPDDPELCAEMEVSKSDLDTAGYYDDYDYATDDSGSQGQGPKVSEMTPEEVEGFNEYKWKALRKPRIPSPAFHDVGYALDDDQRLINRFQKSGLQVIVKMASIELTPEKPEFPAGGWHVEGQMNEHICATVLYYLDSENITDSSLSFRMQTSAYLNDENGFEVGQDCYHWLERIYGTGLGGGGSPCLQNYGNVETRPGRLLAFPNVFQHRVSPFKLIDPTKPGHRRFIAIWLVNPAMRIISTANIPPQQMSWYVDSLLGSSSSARAEALSKLPPDLVTLLADKGVSGVESSENGKLPAELMEMVREFFDADKETLPMSVDEAKQHRLSLMEERKRFDKKADKGWMDHSYSFCEH